MNPIIGWGLAAIGTAMGYMNYGWPGVGLAMSVVVFWLLLQFSRALRVMRVAGQAPVGQLDSAVMLHSKLRTGLRLMEVLPLTKSLGQKLADEPETYAWTDASGASVRLEFAAGRLQRWELQRPSERPSE